MYLRVSGNFYEVDSILERERERESEKIGVLMYHCHRHYLLQPTNNSKANTPTKPIPMLPDVLNHAILFKCPKFLMDRANI